MNPYLAVVSQVADAAVEPWRRQPRRVVDLLGAPAELERGDHVEDELLPGYFLHGLARAAVLVRHVDVLRHVRRLAVVHDQLNVLKTTQEKYVQRL